MVGYHIIDHAVVELYDLLWVRDFLKKGCTMCLLKMNLCIEQREHQLILWPTNSLVGPREE